MTQMTARYPGKCAATGVAFKAGDVIDYDRATKKATLVRHVMKSNDQDLPASYFRTARGLERYGNTTGYVSDVFRTSGGTFYRNKKGRCEDAPACGCCTI